MRNRIIAGFTLLSFMGATGFPALAALSGKGDVESASGQVLVRTSDRQWESFDGRQLAAGDVVRTGGDGQAIFRFGESRVRVAPNTELRVVSLDGGKSELSLERGRVLGKADGSLVVGTAKTSTTATQGEFVLETTSRGSAMRVLSGDARLASTDGSSVDAPRFGAVQPADQAALAGLGGLEEIQAVGDVALLGEWSTKGKGVRIRNTNETVGGEEDASPDQDVPPPRQPQPPVVNTPPTTPPPTTPPTTPPPTTPPTTPPPAAAGGIGVLPIVLGVLLVGGGIALAVGGDDDNDNEFVPENPGVPSPALP